MQKEVKECLDRIQTTLRSWYMVPPNRAAIEAVRSQLGLLEYLVTPKPSWTFSVPVIHNPICSEPGCKAGWQQGLLNHAEAGVDPVWYCTTHLKAIADHHIPGQSYPIGPKRERATDLKKQAEWFLAHDGTAQL